MAARRAKSKGAIAGLRSIQPLGSLAVPLTLEQVPEEIEDKSGLAKQAIFGSNDWKSVQRAVQNIIHGNFNLENNGELYGLHQNVSCLRIAELAGGEVLVATRTADVEENYENSLKDCILRRRDLYADTGNILESKTGTFLRDCYKEWLTKELNFTAGRIRGLTGSRLLKQLEEIWSNFFRNTLPTLEAVMYLVKPKGRISTRHITLAAFRDVVALAADLEGAVRFNEDVSPRIRHMILILQSVNDSYPPNRCKLKMETIAAQVCDVYLGYYGLYEHGDLTVTSNEPMLAAKRRPSADVSGPRRISRPFSVQPQMLDTLDELFKSAVRHRH